MKPRGPFETGTMLALGFGAMGCGTFFLLAAIIPIISFLTKTTEPGSLNEIIGILVFFALLGGIGWYTGVQLILSAGRTLGKTNERDD